MRSKLSAILYDISLIPLERLGLRRWRVRLVSPARGRVLEIGAGTGMNLPHYRHATSLVLTEPDLSMLRRTRLRAADATIPVHLVVADAQALPFRVETFDTVVATLTFCTIPRPAQSFKEIKRVLTQTGELRLLEHVRTAHHWSARWQDAFTPIWRRIAHGCHLNRRTIGTACAQGFIIEQLKSAADGWLVAAVMRRKEVEEME